MSTQATSGQWSVVSSGQYQSVWLDREVLVHLQTPATASFYTASRAHRLLVVSGQWSVVTDGQYQGVRLHREVLVHLQTAASIILPHHEHTGCYWWSLVSGGQYQSVRLDGEILVHLQTPASIILPRHVIEYCNATKKGKGRKGRVFI